MSKEETSTIESYTDGEPSKPCTSGKDNSELEQEHKLEDRTEEDATDDAAGDATGDTTEDATKEKNKEAFDC